MKTPRTDIIVTGNSEPSVDEYEDLAAFTRQLEMECKELKECLKTARKQILERNGLCRDADRKIAMHINLTLSRYEN